MLKFHFLSSRAISLTQPKGNENMRSTSVSKKKCWDPRSGPSWPLEELTSTAPLFSLTSWKAGPGKTNKARPLLSSSKIAYWFSLVPKSAASRPKIETTESNSEKKKILGVEEKVRKKNLLLNFLCCLMTEYLSAPSK